MVESIHLHELLALFPLSSYECFHSMKTNDLVFEGITDNVEDELVNKLIALNGKDDCLQTLLGSIKKSDAAAVVFLGEVNEEIVSLFKENQQFNIPIFRINITFAKMKEAVINLLNLKKMVFFYQFIESSNNMISEIQRIGWTKFTALLKKEWKIDILVADPYFKTVLTSIEGQKDVDKSLSKFKSAYNDNQSNKQPILPTFNFEEKTKGYLQKIEVNHEHLGFLCIIEKDDLLHDIQLAQLKSIIPYIISELKKRKELVLAEKKYQRNFIYDLLHNNFDSLYAIIDQGRTWNWDFTQPHHLILINIIKNDDHSFNQQLVNELELIIINTISSQFYEAKVVELNGQFVIIFSDLTKTIQKMNKEYVKDLANRLNEKISSKLNQTEVMFGIGKFYPSVLDLYRSFQEAKMALQFSSLLNHHSNVTHFDDLGVVRLLSTIRQEQLDDFMDEYIGKLIAFDKKNDSDMVETLQVFLKENGNLKETADALYIHINTLRYRLKKIESTLQVNLQNMEDLLNIILSMKVHGMLTIRN